MHTRVQVRTQEKKYVPRVGMLSIFVQRGIKVQETFHLTF